MDKVINCKNCMHNGMCPTWNYYDDEPYKDGEWCGGYSKFKSKLDFVETSVVKNYLVNLANEWLQMDDKRKYEPANIQVYNSVRKMLDDLEEHLSKRGVVDDN